jgi:6-pyruvoyltetrahydropterin/6-carboxytetrahydropterin synthase
MKKLTTIELSREYLEFSAGHFTIFSATRREKMHGHNFNIHALITAEVTSNGMAFDYAIYKTKLLELCKIINGFFLLPSKSPYLRIEEHGNDYHAFFSHEKLIFPKADVIILPIRNITIEELASWFIEQLIANQAEINEHGIHKFTIKVFSSPGQCASALWERKK